MQPYESRSFRFIELLSIHGWRMKLYGIAWQRELPRPELLEAAKGVTADVLANETANNYKSASLARTMDEMLASSLSISGATRTNCSIGSISRVGTNRSH